MRRGLAERGKKENWDTVMRSSKGSSEGPTRELKSAGSAHRVFPSSGDMTPGMSAAHSPRGGHFEDGALVEPGSSGIYQRLPCVFIL